MKKPTRKIAKLQAYSLKERRLLDRPDDFPYRMVTVDAEVDDSLYDDVKCQDIYSEGMTARILKSEFILDQSMIKLEQKLQTDSDMYIESIKNDQILF